MKNKLIILAASMLAIAASADITEWNWSGGTISPALAGGVYTGGALTFDNNLALAPSYTGTTIDIADIGGLLGTADFTVGTTGPFAGRYTSTSIISGLSAVGDAWLVIDLNGGGIQAGDVLGLGATGFSIIDLQPGGVGPVGTPQTFAGGDITTGLTVTVVPEPATLGLMGIAGLGMFLARKKSRR